MRIFFYDPIPSRLRHALAEAHDNGSDNVTVADEDSSGSAKVAHEHGFAQYI
ncbi:MAG: hypothetical protein ABI488_12310 [Polyangiaceae bacterium]